MAMPWKSAAPVQFGGRTNVAFMTTTWDSCWQKESNHAYWLKPDKAVSELIGKLDRSKARDVLDLGCGIGRHALYLAECGFNVTALDSSSEALAMMKQHFAEKRLAASIINGDYSQALFPEESFDSVLSYNVLYHGDRDRFKPLELMQCPKPVMSRRLY